jgi:L-fucose isomerase-like protein
LAAAAVRRAAGAESDQAEPRTPSSKIRVRRIFLAKPVPSWPTPKLDVPEEINRLKGIIAGLQKEMPDVEFAEGDLLFRRPEDLGNLRERIGDVDAVLVFNLTSSVGSLLKPVATVGVPTILFAQPYSGHDWSLVAGMQKEGMKIECLATSDFHEIVDAMRPIRAIHRMRESRIVYLNTSQASKNYAEKLKAAWGTDIASTDPKRFNAIYAAINEQVVRNVANRWKAGATKIVEPTDKDILDSARFYLTMRIILAEERAQAITINCLGLFGAKQLPAYPCLGFCQLNNDLFVGACEGDLDSTATMLLFRYLVNRPGFISDPVIDTSKNIIIHAHCVSATKMDGPDGEAAPYIIRSHLEDDKGAVLQVKMRVGQPITMAKLVGGEMMLVSTATITDTPEVERGCRTKITTKVADARKILEGYGYGLHRVIFYGDHVRDIKRLSRFVPMQVVEEG